MTDLPPRPTETPIDANDRTAGKMILMGLGAAALGVLVARKAPKTAEKIVRAEERLGKAAATLAAGGGVVAASLAATDAGPQAAPRRSAILGWLTDEAHARLTGVLTGQPVHRVPAGTQLAALARLASTRAMAGVSQHLPAATRRAEAADRAADLRAQGWLGVIRRTISETGRDRVISFAGGITFFALLALFPAITALVSIYGLFADRASIAQHLNLIADFVPAGGVEIIAGQIDRITSTDDTALGLASIVALLIALWSANGGIKALIEGLNVAYGEHEKRNFLVLNVTALTFTLGAIALVIGMIGVIAVLPALTAWLPFTGATEALLTWGRWPLVLVLMMVVLAILYRFGPSRPTARPPWVAPGTVLAALGLVAFSMLFSWYAANFANYNQTYGSLGAVIGFMIWMWLSATIVLIGAEMNHEAERMTGTGATRA